MTDTWDDHAATWDDDDVVRAYADNAFSSLVAYLSEVGGALGGARVLDFGCGTGLLSERLSAAGADVVAIDRSRAMIGVLEGKIAGGLSSVEAHVGGLAVLDTPAVSAGAFDVVVCSSVCAFLDDYPGAAAALVSRLRPGGHFVQWDWEYDATANEPYGLTREAIRAALLGAGLEVRRVDTAFRIPFGDMVMAPLMGAGMRPVS